MNIEERDELVVLFEKYGNLLTQSQKQVLALYLFEDLAISEIAVEIATSRQAINDAIKKGIKKLREIAQKMI